MRRILLVEDEEILRETFTIILSTQPYTIDTAVNGQEALDLCQKNEYDLILLDIMMPVMNGIVFLEKMNELYNELPKIIVMSNLSSGKETEQCLKLGAAKVLLKSGFSPKELISTVRYEVEAN